MNEREQQGLIKAFETTYELAWNTLREAFRLGLIEQGETWMLMIQDRNLTSHTYNHSTADAIASQVVSRYLPLSPLQLQPIAGIPEAAQQRLIQLLAAEPQLEAVWLFGSRAMERHQQSSDIDLCLVAPQLSHSDRLRLMAAVDDLLLPWRVDLAVRHELPADLEAHVQRVGRCIWRKG